MVTSCLTLGTMIFGEQLSRSTPEDEALNIIDSYLGAGGNHIDTADVYAAGRSEEIVGKALKNRRQKALVATKVRFRTSDGINAEGLSRMHVTEGVHSSLRRLQTDYLDLLYLHGFDPLTPMEETLRALEDLVRGGKVRYIGLSNFKAWQVMKARGLALQLNTNCFVAAQYQYSLVKRDLEYEFIDMFASEGLGLLPWGPLGGGFLTGKYVREKPVAGRIASTPKDFEESWERRNTARNWQIMDELGEVAERYGATPSQTAIAWLLAKKVVASAILGVRTLAQLEDNLNAANLVLAPEDVAALDQVSALPELYPYRMIEDYSSRNLDG